MQSPLFMSITRRLVHSAIDLVHDDDKEEP